MYGRESNVNNMAPTRKRNKKGRFLKSKSTSVKGVDRTESICVDHNYVGRAHFCTCFDGCDVCCPGISTLLRAKKISTESWSFGRRVVELSVLVNGLASCIKCNLSPLLLTPTYIKGEMKVGLGGYLYIQCSNCTELNRVPYGSTHSNSSDKGMPSFTVNTKLGTAMIECLGGPQRTNNFLSVMNLPPISHKNLKKMERRGGTMIEAYADENMKKYAFQTFEKETSEDLTKKTQSEDADHQTLPETSSVSSESLNNEQPGLTICADHGWQKKGFDSLTGHTYVISKENKVLKTIVKHRTCATCKWWSRNRPGIRPRQHRCVWNHFGSSKLMEADAGVQAITELIKQGTPVKVLEGDGDNTLVARLKDFCQTWFITWIFH